MGKRKKSNELCLVMTAYEVNDLGFGVWCSLTSSLDCINRIGIGMEKGLRRGVGKRNELHRYL